MTADRSTRRRAVLAARAGATVRGPILASLPCGCCVDDAGGVWRPCPGIERDHAAAVRLARAGMSGQSIELSAILTTIAAHVAEQERAAHQAAEQGALL